MTALTFKQNMSMRFYKLKGIFQMNSKALSSQEKEKKRKKLLMHLKKTWLLYAFVLPMVVYVFIFSYVPMYGVQIAFKNYKAVDGIWGSEWVGFEHFVTFFESYQFETLLWNTLSLSLYGLIAGFPLPIAFALLLNYITHDKFKKTAQMITYAPHFISTVVYCGMILIFLTNDGIINQMLMLLGFDSINFLATPEYFRHIYVWSGVIKNLGWGSILYVSVLASVSQEIHEAAIVDGANKLQRVFHVDLPSIVPTMVIMLIMDVGSIMDVGFQKAFLLQNSINLDYSEIISTYTYKIGLQGGQFSYSAAIGLFNNFINFILLVSVNKIARKTTETSLW